MPITRSDTSKLLTIEQIPLFAGLKIAEKRLIAKKARFQEYRKGDIIYRRGDSPDAFYCIISGRIEIFNEQEVGKEEVLEFLRSGSYFGIISLLTGEPHSVSVRVVNDSTILKIEKDDFDVLLKYIPSLAIHLSQTLSRRLKRKDIKPKLIFESTILSIYSIAKGLNRAEYAINLAVSIANNTKRKVVLLDMGRKGTEIARLLKIEEQNIRVLDLNDPFSLENQIKDKILSIFGISILGVSVGLEDPNIERISPLLSYLTNSFHYIIVDLPYNKDEKLFNMLIQSDIIHILTDCREGASSLIQEFLEVLKRLTNGDLTQRSRLIAIGAEQGNPQLQNLEKNLAKKIFAFIPEPKVLELLINLKGVPIVLSNPNSEYSKAIRKIARTEAGVLVGLALGSGAALGFSHIGVLEVLEKEKVEIDTLSGSSMGALIAVLWASGMNAERLKRIASRFKNILYLINLLDITFPFTGLIAGRRIRSLLEKLLDRKNIEDLNIPVKIIAYDLASREPLIIDKGSAVDAVMKSISVPGIFRPVIEGDSIVIDGGVCEPVPIGPLINAGIKRLIAVNVLPAPEDILEKQRILKKCYEEENEIFKKGPFFKRVLIYVKRFLRRLFLPNIYDVIMSSMQAMEYVMAEESCKKADVVIRPIIPEITSIEFYNSEKLIKKGEEETKRLLPEICALLSE